jgi:hypothetical protein
MANKQYRRETLYKIIIQYDHPAGGIAFAKYRNIEVDKPASWRKTAHFLKQKFPSLHHINVYGGISGLFIRQIGRNNL